MDHLHKRIFDDALPSEKAHRLIEGMDFLSAEMARHVSNIKILNGWLRQMPALVASDRARFEPGDDNLLVTAVGDYTIHGLQAARSLTELALLCNDLNNALDHFRGITPDSE